MNTGGQQPLIVLERVVGAIFGLILVLTALVAVGAAFGSGSIPGLTSEVCVSTRSGDGIAIDPQLQGADAPGSRDLRAGVTRRTESVQLCDTAPDATSRALGAAGVTVWIFAPMIFFGLLWRMLRAARRDGAFADRIPPHLRTLGAFLLVWATLSFVVTGFVNAGLLNRMLDNDDLVLFSSADVPWLLVLLGIAFLALSGVMAQAVAMRHDVEATI